MFGQLQKIQAWILNQVSHPMPFLRLRPTPPFSRPHGMSQNEHAKRRRGSAGTAG